MLVFTMKKGNTCSYILKFIEGQFTLIYIILCIELFYLPFQDIRYHKEQTYINCGVFIIIKWLIIDIKTWKKEEN